VRDRLGEAMARVGDAGRWLRREGDCELQLGPDERIARNAIAAGAVVMMAIAGQPGPATF
jgi:hypothetical protein